MNNTIIFILSFINIFSELIELTYDLGAATRKYVVPALVYTYCLVDCYVKPALTIPYYYGLVRQERLATS